MTGLTDHGTQIGPAVAVSVAVIISTIRGHEDRWFTVVLILAVS